jgi:hypothetical protein
MNQRRKMMVYITAWRVQVSLFCESGNVYVRFDETCGDALSGSKLLVLK